MSFLSPGGAVPLFDKLAQSPDTALPAAGSVLSIDGVEASVAAELGRLLASRSRIPLSMFTDASLTVLDYGIPDYAGCHLDSDEDCSLLKAAIRHAIEAFEPRLTDTEIYLRGSPTGKSIGAIGIAANLRVSQAVRRVSFTLATDATTSPASTAHAIAEAA